MARDLLLEIGVEEMPSAYMPNTIDNLKNAAAEKLAQYRLNFSGIKTFGTPRRLTLVVEGLEEQQADARIENRGPKKSIAFDGEGNPTKAGLGFARGQGMKFEDLEIRNVAGIDYLFAVKIEAGHLTNQLLGDVLLDIITSLSFPKSMRWGYCHTRFARPIRWILALYGKELIDLQIENIKSSNYTFGHRFLSLGQMEIIDAAHYLQQLEKSYVILDPARRKEIIRQQVLQAAREVKGKPMENEALLEEITYLVEYPTAFYGEFSPSYLDVPPEVLTTTMIEHQRYFPVFDKKGKLLPGFIGVRNGTGANLEVVKAGNERVLKARLEDALFFWKEDTKKPLEEMVAGLKEVLFHERLGSVFDKAERLQKLAEFMGKETKLSSRKKLNRAARLCKADLVSSMVYEFTELQGVMGRYYALNSGEDKEVAQAIFEHYLPRFAGDRLPATATGKVLSLAEKLDNLVGCFSIGIKPTGSQDPYALRRQAMGIVNIILDSSVTLDLNRVIEKAYNNFAQIKPDYSLQETRPEVIDFILQRMRGVLLEKGFSYDVIDAVFAVPLSDLNDVLSRVKTIHGLKEAEDFQDFLVVYNRANNLSKKWDSELFESSVLVDDSETELVAKYQSITNEANLYLEKGEYAEAIKVIAELRPWLDNFFESVMVMVEDERLRASRLGLLKAIANLCTQIADFSKIVA